MPAIALGLAVFLPAFGTQGLNAVRLEVARSLGIAADDGFRIGLVMAVFQLASVIAYAFVGPWSDRVGRRPLLVGGVVVFLAAHLLLLVSASMAAQLVLPAWALFLGLRVVAGLAGGAITVTANALGAELYPPEQRGRSMSLVWLGVPLALVIGVPLPAWLAPLWRRLPEGVRPWLGDPYAAVAAAAAILVLALVLAKVPKGAAFPIGATRARTDGSLTPSLRRWGALVASFLMPLSVFELLASSAAHTHSAFGYGEPQNGTLYLLIGAGSVVGALLSSAVADRVGKRRCLWLAQAAFALFTPLLVLCGELGFVALATFLGLVSTMRQGPFQALASLLAGPGGRGRMSAQVLASAAIGGGVGQFLGSALFDWGGMAVVVASAAVAMGLALLLSLPLRESVPAAGVAA